MKKTISMVSSLIQMMTRTAAEKKSAKMIFAKDLPKAVKFFVQRNFSNRSIVFAEMRFTSKGMIYVVSLDDGIQVVFNESGCWEMVDCNRGVIPGTLVPARVATFMDAFYPSIPIIKIEKIDHGYEVTLSDYSTLQFGLMEYVA